jgi:hypothetical protein
MYPAEAVKQGICFVDCFTQEDVKYDRPPAPILSPIPSSSNYTLRHRYDVRFVGTDYNGVFAVREPDYLPDHVRVMKVSTEASGPHQVVEFAYRQPICLEQIGDIAQGQITAGYPTASRLKDVSADNALPYDVHDFRTLASIVSTSLVRFAVTGPLERTRITFKDLPQIFDVIHTSLPVLRELVLRLGGLQDAETFCGNLLSSDILSRRGRLDVICLHTGDNAGGPLFNVLRYCLQHVVEADWPDLSIWMEGHDRRWQAHLQRDMIKYLRE